ncbi:hypothetical protein Dshi_2513 [Dinoroseobacter shibae DFL 12 = DSM 16493]|jgi:hypothetical protein|uniref:Uncharacterized protein n=1 Tax=Dinoroseobacter shibae (strain DSM 16493 / NCIMB 14021 / DFL 12) TaxID=398580 RepID=A8LSP7_DINSH|nr:MULTISPECIES: hypothetical protein [Dinoroseobacter]ABV94246.1 hypothetical protein Dshi_2513 [Dinoroseobacter shibae DFL 12 = DSM 16493]MDD9717786.1 hypothetical protein [Dinoroseobacter sp. PD6]URF45685.1 hypothetical protein M8008_12970 [Dinoroseobacter shibae]URF49990.1 hypothetical protein M8007_12970 [Dinoroseobacter shibae]
MIRTSLAVLLLAIATPTWAANFTTAAEVKPILDATKSSWVAIRKLNGQDLLYFTQIESWRCGLTQITFRVNGAPETYNKFMEPCYEGTPAPNAFRLDSHLPYVTFQPDSLTSVEVTLTYEDGTTDTATFQRSEIELQ